MHEKLQPGGHVGQLQTIFR